MGLRDTVQSITVCVKMQTEDRYLQAKKEASDSSLPCPSSQSSRFQNCEGTLLWYFVMEILPNSNTTQRYLILSCVSQSSRITAPLQSQDILIAVPSSNQKYAFQYTASNNTFMFVRLFFSTTFPLLYNLSGPLECWLFHTVCKTLNVHLLIVFPN